MTNIHQADKLSIAWSILLAVVAGALMWALIVTAAVLIGYAIANAQTTVIRDWAGRTVGTSSTSGHVTTYRDASGRTTGTARTDQQGTTTYRDPSGRYLGSSRRTGQ
jgi:YD repeat-containing protein